MTIYRKDASCLHVQQISSQLEKPPRGSIPKYPDPPQQHKGSSPPRFLQISEPPHRQKLWQLQPCCSVTTQHSGPNVSVGTTGKSSASPQGCAPSSTVPSLRALASKQEAIRQSLGALWTFHALGSLGNDLMNLPPCHRTTNGILPVRIANFCGRCLKSLSVVTFLWSRLAVNHFL